VCDYFDVKLNKANQERLALYDGADIVFGIRPEDVLPSGDIPLDVSVNENLGMNTLVHGHIKGKRLVAKFKGWVDHDAGDVVGISFDQDKMHFFDKATTKAIR
jgi:multiple sugar transport system ATP-binding protein